MSDNKVQTWITRIQASKRREKDYRDRAKKLMDVYEGQKLAANSFNILYSNTETMRSAVLSAIPRPRVRQRYPDQQPVAALAARAVERALTYLTDTGSAAQSPFGSLLKESVKTGLVAGRANAVFMYEPRIGAALYATPDEKTSTKSEDQQGDSSEAPMASNAAVEEPTEDLEEETICGYTLSYDRVIYGYSRSWDDLPWIAIEYPMTRGDLVKNFGPEKGKQVVIAKDGGDNMAEQGEADSDKVSGQPNTAVVYAVWNKETRKVLFISEGYPDDVLKEVDDPLQLSGFFPVPEQLAFFTMSESLIPVPLFKFYEEQAKELNRVTQRINKLISVMKARGIYDATLLNLNELQSKEDGQFQPLEQAAALANGTINNAVWVWPIEKFITVLQQLYIQREQTKQVIYEITGLSDIIRGSTVASETATAQTIKNKWGTLRLQDSQDLVGVYARSCFRIMAEIAINTFHPETWERMTKLGLLTKEQQAQKQQQLQQLTAQGQQILAQAQTPVPQPGGMPPQGPAGPPQAGPPQGGTPTAAPSIPPQLQQQIEAMKKQGMALQQEIAKPTWDDIIAELRENVKDGYLIDIQTNSTINASSTEDKADITALVTGITQMLQAFGPALQSGAVPPSLVKTLLLALLQNYRFGDEVMEQVRALPDQMPNQGQKPDPAADKAKAEIAVLQQKAQIDEKSGQMDLALQGEKLNLEREKIALEREKMGLEKEKMAAEHQNSMEDISNKRTENAAKSQMRLETARQRMLMQGQPQAPQPGGGTPQMSPF